MNSAMELSSDLVTLYNLGNLPVLTEMGRVEMDIRNSHSRGMSLWALSLEGDRSERISIASADNNSLRTSIDTTALKNGPTPFF